MEFTSGNKPLAELEEGVWYHLQNHGRNHSNEITSVKQKGKWMYVRLSGGEFIEPFLVNDARLKSRACKSKGLQ